jgi:glycogen phosphorylase
MIDVFAKRVTPSKRQILYLFYLIHRYLLIKDTKAHHRTQGATGKVLHIVSGRAPHSHFEGKKIIQAFYSLAALINHDPALEPYMKIVFIPNFNVHTCELLVTAADTSQHISTPGSEPSGTSNMKYIMNGGLLIGSRDGANLEIEREVGSGNIFMFGSDKNRLFAYQKFVRTPSLLIPSIVKGETIRQQSYRFTAEESYGMVQDQEGVQVHH